MSGRCSRCLKQAAQRHPANHRLGGGLAALLALALIALPPAAQALGGEFYIGLATRVLVFALAATSLNLVLGFGGMVSFGHAAFLGLGAYAAALAMQAGLGSAWVVWPLAMGVAAAAAFVVGDSFDGSIRDTARTTLGPVDEIVRVVGIATDLGITEDTELRAAPTQFELLLSDGRLIRQQLHPLSEAALVRWLVTHKTGYQCQLFLIDGTEWTSTLNAIGAYRFPPVIRVRLLLQEPQVPQVPQAPRMQAIVLKDN